MTGRFLVTGGTGFIGSALVRALVRKGDRVRVLDNNSRGALRRLSDVVDVIDFVEADIRDADAVRKAAVGVDCFVHLAYVNGTRYFYEQPELVLDIAIRGMLSVIDACRANGIGDLILASSSEAYQTPPIIPTPEDVPLVVPNILNPRYSYGGGKLACELMAINYGRTGFNRVTIFRPHNVYGPDMGHEHVLPQFVERACKLIDATPQGRVDFEIQGDGTQTRAFVHIDDFTDGLMTVIDKGKHLEIYHIGNPEEIAIRDLVPKVFRTLGREANVITGPLTEGSTQRRCPNISKLAALGYAPRISIDAGLPSLVDWYARHRAGNSSEG